ncbi:hypothetical protein Pmani_039376 [Petrolisthes manimaculis]|uniref:Uncharacterized protein n=1 Tax=Petrolisthes manimaculis TaxID=1843537 RepID=A0AAE1TLE1_9EUCA|nr:hypothetical protein Pmani_039376 [Petrolisthes manimaculis]
MEREGEEDGKISGHEEKRKGGSGDENGGEERLTLQLPVLVIGSSVTVSVWVSVLVNVLRRYIIVSEPRVPPLIRVLWDSLQNEMKGAQHHLLSLALIYLTLAPAPTHPALTSTPNDLMSSLVDITHTYGALVSTRTELTPTLIDLRPTLTELTPTPADFTPTLPDFTPTYVALVPFTHSPDVVPLTPIFTTYSLTTFSQSLAPSVYSLTPSLHSYTSPVITPIKTQASPSLLTNTNYPPLPTTSSVPPLSSRLHHLPQTTHNMSSKSSSTSTPPIFTTNILLSTPLTHSQTDTHTTPNVTVESHEAVRGTFSGWSDEWSSGYGDDKWSSGYGDDEWSSGYGDDKWSSEYGDDEWSSGYGDERWTSGRNGEWSGSRMSSDWVSGGRVVGQRSGRSIMGVASVSGEGRALRLAPVYPMLDTTLGILSYLAFAVYIVMLFGGYLTQDNPLRTALSALQR